MQLINKIVCCLTVYFPILAFASPDESVFSERALREECSDAYFSQVEVRECLAKKAADSQQALQQAEAQMVSTFAKWDEWESVITRAKANLAASNKSFIKYRYDQCELVASLGGGAIGAALDMGRLACVAELNNRRAAQLRDAVSGLNQLIELPSGEEDAESDFSLK